MPLKCNTYAARTLLLQMPDVTADATHALLHVYYASSFNLRTSDDDS